MRSALVDHTCRAPSRRAQPGITKVVFLSSPSERARLVEADLDGDAGGMTEGAWASSPIRVGPRVVRVPVLGDPDGRRWRRVLLAAQKRAHVSSKGAVLSQSGKCFPIAHSRHRQHALPAEHVVKVESAVDEGEASRQREPSKSGNSSDTAGKLGDRAGTAHGMEGKVLICPPDAGEEGETLISGGFTFSAVDEYTDKLSHSEDTAEVFAVVKAGHESMTVDMTQGQGDTELNDSTTKPSSQMVLKNSPAVRFSHHSDASSPHVRMYPSVFRTFERSGVKQENETPSNIPRDPGTMDVPKASDATVTTKSAKKRTKTGVLMDRWFAEKHCAESAKTQPQVEGRPQGDDSPTVKRKRSLGVLVNPWAVDPEPDTSEPSASCLKRICTTYNADSGGISSYQNSHIGSTRNDFRQTVALPSTEEPMALTTEDSSPSTSHPSRPAATDTTIGLPLQYPSVSTTRSTDAVTTWQGAGTDSIRTVPRRRSWPRDTVEVERFPANQARPSSLPSTIVDVSLSGGREPVFTSSNRDDDNQTNESPPASVGVTSIPLLSSVIPTYPSIRDKPTAVTKKLAPFLLSQTQAPEAEPEEMPVTPSPPPLSPAPGVLVPTESRGAGYGAGTGGSAEGDGGCRVKVEPVPGGEEYACSWQTSFEFGDSDLVIDETVVEEEDMVKT